MLFNGCAVLAGGRSEVLRIVRGKAFQYNQFNTVVTGVAAHGGPSDPGFDGIAANALCTFVGAAEARVS